MIQGTRAPIGTAPQTLAAGHYALVQFQGSTPVFAARPPAACSSAWLLNPDCVRLEPDGSISFVGTIGEDVAPVAWLLVRGQWLPAPPLPVFLEGHLS